MFTGKSFCHYNCMKAAKMLETNRLVKGIVKTWSKLVTRMAMNFFRSHVSDPACRENMFGNCTQIEFFSKM